MECNCNNNNNGGVIPWVRGNRLPLCICIYQMNVDQGTVSTMAYNNMTRTPYAIQADDTVTVTMKSGFRSVEMPFTTDGNKVLVIDNGELPTGTYTVEVTIERGSGERGRWQESRQVRIYENTDEAILGEMYSIEADLFFWAKGDTGNGIANITSNPDNTLTITMTDGTTYTTQAMKGDKGDQGDQGEKGTSIVSFDVTGQTETSVIYTVTFSDDTTEEIAVPKGPQGDTGLTGNGISSTTLNSDYTLTIAYTDGTTYTTPSIRGAQGVQGVSIIAFTQTGETATNTLYNVVFSDGRTQSVAIPKGLKGDKGDTGNTGPQGAQGPKGDTVTATDYTLYNVQGSDSQGAMSQDATTKAISAQTGYYTCGAAADKVDKVAAVENGNLYKRTLGGHFKVKMTNANTASGVTLQVGSETATTLWYNGAAASASNSWDAGEVLSVYYDGTHYQASNAQGGGGKAEKIKYDNSASGLAAENVQEALDKVGKSFDYVTRNVPLIALNTNYSVDTILKDSKGAILRVIKPVTTLRNVETLAIGDLKTAGTSGTTYKAVAAIADYNSSAEYSEGAYARGTFASNALTVTVDTAAEGTITIKAGDEEHSVSVDSESIAEGLATTIAALSFAGWAGSANGAVATFTRNKVGSITNPFTVIVSSGAGVTVTPAYTNGTGTVRKFDGSSWTVKTAAELKSDTNLFTAITSVEGNGNLIALATQPNSATQDIKKLETHLFSPENNNYLIFNNFRGSGYTITFSTNPVIITAVAPSVANNSSRAFWDLRYGVSNSGVTKELINGNTYYFRIKASSTKSVGLGFIESGEYTLTKRLLTIPEGGSVDGIYTFVYDSSCPLFGFPKVTSSTYGARIVIEEAYFCDYIPIEDRAVFKKDIVEGFNIEDEDKVLGAKAGKILYQKISRYINLDLSKYSVRTYAISSASPYYWTSDQTKTIQGHIVIKVIPGRTYKVVKNQSRVQQDYTWLTTNTGTRNQSTPAPVLGGYGIMYMTSNDVYELTAPEGANYLYIRVRFSTEDAFYPTSIEAPEECMEAIDDLETRVAAVETMGAELIETIKPYSNTTLWAGTSQWEITADKTFGLFLRTDVPNTSIQIKSNTANSSYYYFLKGIYGAGNEKLIDNCDGCSRVTITKNTTTNWIDVPDDCRFVWIGLNNSTGTDFSPREIKIKYYLKDKEQSKVDLGNYEESNSLNVKIKNVKRNSAFTFLQFSDIHGDVANMNRISKLINYYKDYIDVVINCGDIVDKTATESLDWYATAVNGIDKEVLDVVGNHDYWNSTSQTEENRGYNKIIKPLVQRDSTIIQPSNAEAEYKCYYYKDFGNIRLIVLSSFDTESMRTWDEDQKSWLEDVLADAVGNKQVIIANHATYSYQGNGFTGVSSDLVYANYNDYFNRRPNTFTEYRVSPSRNWLMSDEVLSCVKNFMDDGGTFICYLCGHTHRDLIVDIDDHETYGYQPMICISTSNANKVKNSGVNNEGMELLVNMIGIDTSRSLIKLVRVGCNRDMFQQQKNEWVYSYDLHRMIINN